MLRRRPFLLVAFVVLASHASCLRAQSVGARPYDASLRSDPAVGNVQGIQRYGRSLKTDPDEGVGYSYHVYPVAEDSNAAYVNQAMMAQMMAAQVSLANQGNQPATGSRPSPSPTQGGEDGEGLSQLQGFGPQASGGDDLPSPQAANPAAFTQQAFNPYSVGPAGGFSPFSGRGYGVGPLPYAMPGNNTFDATRGLRSYETGFSAPDALSSPLAAQALYMAQAIGVEGGTQITNLYHQPLIQIKVRVVEVNRSDTLQVGSILEYVSSNGLNGSRTSGATSNNSSENMRSISRLLADGLTQNATTGAGALINLTTEHINWAVQLLSTDFEGDVVTAPEVVTLNGQNVEFISGAKVPFQLGQNVIQGTNNNIQQFFYKNVGTYVSVTPKIVNWGLHGEAGGEAAIVESEIQDWNLLASILLQREYFPDLTEVSDAELKLYQVTGKVVPVSVQTKLLKELNRYSRSQLFGHTTSTDGELIHRVPGIFRAVEPAAVNECASCKWSPSDCTIDLSLVVRLSEQGKDEITIDGTQSEVDVTTEANVRAIANVIQIRSGEGVVMAGLIGNRDQVATSKIPVLGDIPYLGSLFRNKNNTRQKTEVLIFLEAEVLDQRPEVARHQSGEDFRLSQPYLGDSVLDNPMEATFYRAGMGSYLPAARRGEQAYWERNYRKIRKASLSLQDMVR